MGFNHRFRNIVVSALVLSLPFVGDASDLCCDEDEKDVFLQAVEQTMTAERDMLAADIISYASSFIGRPYRRGGKGPKSFDCSGFTGYIFKHFDTGLAASSRDQFLQGREIDSKDIRPGDLVFFSSRRSGRSVGHVGIAVEVSDSGQIRFIHAAHRGGIRIDSYPDGGYYSSHFVGARRVL